MVKRPSIVHWIQAHGDACDWNINYHVFWFQVLGTQLHRAQCNKMIQHLHLQTITILLQCIDSCLRSVDLWACGWIKIMRCENKLYQVLGTWIAHASRWSSRSTLLQATNHACELVDLKVLLYMRNSTSRFNPQSHETRLTASTLAKGTTSSLRAGSS